MNEEAKNSAVFEASAKLDQMQSLAAVALDIAEGGSFNPVYLTDMLNILIDGIVTANNYLEKVLGTDERHA